MPESVALSAFRDLSVRGAEKQNVEKVLSRAGSGRKKKNRKRIHLVRNPFICLQCWKFWSEEEAKNKEKQLFVRSKDPAKKPVHKGCGGVVWQYYELSAPQLIKLSEKVSEESAFRSFYPSMGNLIREDNPEVDHHNASCEGICCHQDKDGSLGPEPSSTADVRCIMSLPAFWGWEEQGGKTCAAASVAGALNTLFCGYEKASSQASSRTASSSNSDSSRGSSRDIIRQPMKEKAQKDKEDKKQGNRVSEQDVIDYYCKWARETGRISCHAALRGSCGLIPSTRKIGNPRLLRGCHAVAKMFFRGKNEEGENDRCAVHCPQLGPTDACSSSDEDSDSDSEDLADIPSPIETSRLMGNWCCRDNIEEGGRCCPEDGDTEITIQWNRMWIEIAKGNSLLLHFRNHYSLVFGLREWKCESTNKMRRQLLTATSKQRPHVWFCFQQLRADIIYSKVNQVMLIKRAPTTTPPTLPIAPANTLVKPDSKSNHGALPSFLCRDRQSS